MTRKEQNKILDARFEFYPLGKAFNEGLDKTIPNYQEEGIIKLLKEIRDNVAGLAMPPGTPSSLSLPPSSPGSPPGTPSSPGSPPSTSSSPSLPPSSPGSSSLTNVTPLPPPDSSSSSSLTNVTPLPTPDSSRKTRTVRPEQTISKIAISKR